MLESKPVYMLRNYLYAIEDQLDYQRLGGICARHPYSCYICNVLRVVRDTLGLGNRLLDITYGAGSFYVACRREYHIVGVDIVRHDWLVEPDKFIQCDVTSEGCYTRLLRRYFDILVVDPPYPTESTSRTRSHDVISRFYGGSRAYTAIMEAVPRIASLTLKENGVILIKGMDVTVDSQVHTVYNAYHWAIYYREHGMKPRAILYFRSRTYRRPRTKGNMIVKNYSWLLLLTR